MISAGTLVDGDGGFGLRSHCRVYGNNDNFRLLKKLHGDLAKKAKNQSDAKIDSYETQMENEAGEKIFFHSVPILWPAKNKAYWQLESYWLQVQHYPDEGLICDTERHVAVIWDNKGNVVEEISNLSFHRYLNRGNICRLAYNVENKNFVDSEEVEKCKTKAEKSAALQSILDTYASEKGIVDFLRAGEI